MKSAHLVTCMACLLLAGGCAMTKHDSHEQEVQLSQVSAPARATIERETRGGTIEKITSETEHKRAVYDVEANVGGKHMEYLIAADTGEVLGTEVPIAFGDVPAPVKAAAEKHFGTTSGLTAMKSVEFGETNYEIEGMKNGKRHEVSFHADGSPEK